MDVAQSGRWRSTPQPHHPRRELTPTPSDGDLKHLRWLRERIGDDLVDAVVVTAGPRAYRRPDGIAVVPLGLLGP
jgi:hypothetical protein